MIIRLYPENNALPIGPAVNRVGSALPLRIIGAPSGATGVAVSVFNSDGTACNLDATRHGGEWVTTVPASHFASWGKVARGLQVAVSFKDATEATQTVVFVGDVRIEKTAAGDPEGTGKRSVPVTDVDEVAAGSSMKEIRDKVNELARIVSGTATALVLMALPLSAATPLEDIPGTNEVYTAAETDAAIIAATSAIPSAAQAAISTNNPAFVAAVTNCPVVIAAADGTTIGEFGEYGTLGALLAALAAAITWLKTNKADAASLPYALVDVTVQTWAFSGTAAGAGHHWECVYDNGVWALYNVPDGSTWEDVPNPTDFIAGGGGSSETEIEFNSAGVTATKTTPTAHLTDRAVNRVTLGSGAESAVFRFPAKTQGKARDFMLRLVITGSTVPEIGFVESDGTTEVAFDADDDSWADIEQGVNILMFTDTQEASA